MGKLGKLIRSERKKKKLQVKELAKIAGINPVYLTNIEVHGRLPSIPILRKIARELDSFEIIGQYLSEKYPEMDSLYKDIVVHRRKKHGLGATFYYSLSNELDYLIEEQKTPKQVAHDVLHDLNPALAKKPSIVKKLAEPLNKLNKAIQEIKKEAEALNFFGAK